ncbi:hypothetical protein DMW08_29120 [Vibrio parahaemolyticus]|nr:hypothetical protein [Vibrio parahaemolyticus]EGR2988435.1 hypothetical protein [Vibrio parahaemolyticus]
MNDIIKRLRSEFGIYRQSPVGKRIGYNFWFHVSYAECFGVEIEKFLNSPKIDFMPTIIKINNKTNAISLIQCDEFDSQDCPVIGKVLTFRQDGSCKLTKQSENPFIYHHKWLFVADDYNGFDINQSKLYSYIWKSLLGVDPSVSSIIGRYHCWCEILKKHKIENLTKLWLDCDQKVSSKKTSMNSRNKPKIFGLGCDLGLFRDNTVNLDIGGGKFETGTKFLSKIGVTNLIIDPFNRPVIDNANAIIQSKKHGVDTVTISNVLNVIIEDTVKLKLIEQAFDALNDDGTLLVTCYEGNRSGVGCFSSKDSWQENKKTAEYLPLISKIFPKSHIKKGLIIAKK